MCWTKRGFAVAIAAALHLTLAGSLTAQVTINGQVVDDINGQPIAVALVTIGEESELTNNDGRFSIEVAPGNYTVVVQVGAYEAGTAVVNASSGTVNVTIRLVPTGYDLDPIVVTGSRGRSDRTSAMPAQVSVVTGDLLEVQATTSAADAVKALPGVDAQQTGLNQTNVVARGFNNIFSGALLVLTDYRYARVPSLRFNAYNMIPTTPLDVERVELALGPASALYGPNSANGVMHIITTSPIDKPGTAVSIAGGNRSIFDAAFRQAFKFNDQVGFKISGQYFRGNDFEYIDPVEVQQSQDNPGNPRIGERDFDSEKWSTEARLDIRPWDDPQDGIIATYGRSLMINSVELTGIGGGMAKDWKYEFGQLRVRKGGFFGQAFMNRTDAGDTYLLRPGSLLVDSSTVVSAQGQYSFSVADAADLVAGVDLIQTTPRTGGTINGMNEDIDETREIGAYLSATVPLSDQVSAIGALRVDDHEHLEDPVWSPRLGLVVTPVPGQTFRATYNRAFGTPTQNNLFLDLTAGLIPLPGGAQYRIQTTGVPTTGYTWNDQCTGGVMSYCMQSPFAPGTQLPAAGDPLWDGVLVPLILSDATIQATLPLLGLTPAQFATIIGSPQPGDLTSYLLRFNSENPSIPFLPDAGVEPVSAILPTITTTYEVGYQGLVADDRIKLSAALYRNEIKDFVGPLRVETPNVFLDGASVATFLATRMVGAGIPAATAQAIAAGVAPTIAMAPLGTVAPDQRSNSDIILTYRNFGEVQLWGFDFGFEAKATQELTLIGSYSFVSDECFDFNDDGDCSSTADIALNAPTNKGSIGFRYDDRGSGWVFGGRMRASGEFPMNSGVYLGTVHSFAVFDANVAYRVPGYESFIISGTVNNLLNNEHREFVGAPRLGRVAMVKLQYAIGG